MPALAHLRSDHDETLIARLAAHDLTGPEAAIATQLVTDCPACAELHSDLRSIIAATAKLPAARRTRDFRLTQADAARLQRTGWRRLLGRFGDPRLAFTRPLATGLVTLGIAGLLLSAAPSFLPSLGSPTSAPAAAPVAGGVDTTIFGPESGANPGDGVNAAASAAPFNGTPLPVPLPSGPVASAVSVPNQPVAAASPGDLGAGGVGVVAPPPAGPVLEENPGVGKSTDASAGTSSAPSLVLLASIALLVLGVALFALRWVARRTA